MLKYLKSLFGVVASVYTGSYSSMSKIRTIKQTGPLMGFVWR